MSTPTLLEHLQSLHKEALQALEQASTLDALEAWRITYLGRKDGKLTQVLRALPTLPLEVRREVGRVGNALKDLLEERYAQRLEALKAQEVARKAQAGWDVTLPGRPVVRGRLHPTTRIVQEICQAFVAMGFQVVEGPEVEWDRYNFALLNIPQDHPARDMWNTLWVDYVTPTGERPMLLRTHTSPMQARIMERMRPPIRVVVPGKCYRYEATDATHEWHFFQIEGLAVDEGITFADLKGTLYEFARRIFGPDRRIRFRCDYFPFVEPGVDMAIDCFACKGGGCRICKGSGWIEIMGAGMVHPRVLEMVGYDSQKYTGFAFGMGPERIAMLKWGIEDIRLFYANDLRFLRQF
ncbi:MAG: phenylalanine--tRNA ligase subunit alpha [Dehalococcoidia bacterium]|nr:phenylalanine--tRNA ligase subunit alpha [Dehalococcoidia bacterium]MDW8120075.1 phenylalanine--tRNA ligase subunit alpha [Chloroflexota bacterium]